MQYGATWATACQPGQPASGAQPLVSDIAQGNGVGRDDPYTALAGGDEDESGAAADDADLEGGDGPGVEYQHREASG